MMLTLENHPIWETLTQALTQFDANQIAIQHLQFCNAQINGYWDDDEFYELVSFTQLPSPELSSISLGISPEDVEVPHWLHLKFTLKPHPSTQLNSNEARQPDLGELILILDDALNVVDENWLLNLHSPYVQATR
jgi:hypothetical protein